MCHTVIDRLRQQKQLFPKQKIIQKINFSIIIMHWQSRNQAIILRETSAPSPKGGQLRLLVSPGRWHKPWAPCDTTARGAPLSSTPCTPPPAFPHLMEILSEAAAGMECLRAASRWNKQGAARCPNPAGSRLIQVIPLSSADPQAAEAPAGTHSSAAGTECPEL